MTGSESKKHRTGAREPRDAPVAEAKVLRSLDKTVLSLRARDVMRESILRGDLPPSHHLVEADIAKQLGVSRAPVREAIRLLQQDGLVEFFPHRGAVVIGTNSDEIDIVYELRALVEAKAIVRACDRRSEEDLARLAAELSDLATHLNARELSAATESDIRFHRIIVEISGLTMLARMWDGFDGMVRVRSMQALERPGRVAEEFLADGVASHQALLDAIRERDRKEAERLVQSHILEVAARIREAGATPPDGSDPP